jgi:hypothetical protein
VGFFAGGVNSQEPIDRDFELFCQFRLHCQQRFVGDLFSGRYAAHDVSKSRPHPIRQLSRIRRHIFIAECYATSTRSISNILNAVRCQITRRTVNLMQINVKHHTNYA